MAKKREPQVKKILSKYFQEFLSFLLSSLEEGTGDLLRKFKDIANLKKRLQRYIISAIMITAALVVALYGVGLLLESFFPGLRPGVSHILVGILFILIALAYRKYR